MFSYMILALSLITISALIIALLRLPLPSRKILIMIIIILALAMLIFDGYLTALPIVLYNSKSVLAFRLGSIPLEDFSYLIVVVLLVPALFEKFHHGKKD